MPTRRELLAAGLAAAPASALAAESDQARLRARALAHWRQSQAPGMAFGVIRNGKPFLTEGFGVRTLGKAQKVGERTLFHMASVSKTLVATMILKRNEQGQLSLQTPLTTAISGFRLDDPRAAAITIEQLLIHTSGLPDVDDFEWDRPQTDELALARYVAGLAKTQLLFEPGASWSYSDIGYNLLARVIEITSHSPFEEAAHQDLLDPLGMTSSSFFYPQIDRSQTAAPHRLEGGQLRPSPVWPYNRPHAGSSTLTSNLHDMFAWMQVNLQGGQFHAKQIFSPDLAASLLRARSIPGLDAVYPGAKRALGWFILPTPSGEVAFHPGSDDGFVSMCAINPAQQSGLTAMINRSDDEAKKAFRVFCMEVMSDGTLDRTA